MRDTFYVRAATGLHGTEVARLASGAGTVRIVNDPSGIYAVVAVRHKNGHEHLVSVDRRTYDALARLVARGGAGGSSSVWAALRKASGETRVHAGRLRHTWATLALVAGRQVFPAAAGGLPRQVVADALGHSLATNRRHYDGVAVPAMVVVPLVLQHPEDPAPMGTRFTRGRR
jgi:integrase